MSLEEAWREHAYAEKRFRKEWAKGNTDVAWEHWRRAKALWEAIGEALR